MTYVYHLIKILRHNNFLKQLYNLVQKRPIWASLGLIIIENKKQTRVQHVSTALNLRELKPQTAYKINILPKRYTRLYIDQKRHIYNLKTKFISFKITIITETEAIFTSIFYLISQTKSTKNLVQDDVFIPFLHRFL